MSRQIGDIPTRTFNPGDVIFKEGDDPKGEAFIVHIGTVEIKKLIAGEQRLLNTVRKGSLLGEFGLFRDAQGMRPGQGLADQLDQGAALLLDIRAPLVPLPTRGVRRAGRTSPAGR